MDTALLQELQHTLDLLAQVSFLCSGMQAYSRHQPCGKGPVYVCCAVLQAKACIDGSAAHLRCVTADLSTTVTRLRGST